jgi:hypothetical protein
MGGHVPYRYGYFSGIQKRVRARGSIFKGFYERNPSALSDDRGAHEGLKNILSGEAI